MMGTQEKQLKKRAAGNDWRPSRFSGQHSEPPTRAAVGEVPAGAQFTLNGRPAMHRCQPPATIRPTGTGQGQGADSSSEGVSALHWQAWPGGLRPPERSREPATGNQSCSLVHSTGAGPGTPRGHTASQEGPCLQGPTSVTDEVRRSGKTTPRQKGNAHPGLWGR